MRRGEGGSEEPVRLGDLARTQLDQRYQLPGRTVRVGRGSDDGVDVTGPLDSQDVEAWAHNPFVFASDQLTLEVLGQPPRVVLGDRTNIGQTTESLAGLRVLGHHVGGAYLRRGVEVASLHRVDISLDDLSVGFWSQGSHLPLTYAIARLCCAFQGGDQVPRRKQADRLTGAVQDRKVPDAQPHHLHRHHRHLLSLADRRRVRRHHHL